MRDFLDNFIPWEHEWRGRECWAAVDLSRPIAAAMTAWCNRTGIKRVVTEDAEMWYYKRKVKVVRYDKDRKDWAKVWRKFTKWVGGLDAKHRVVS